MQTDNNNMNNSRQNENPRRRAMRNPTADNKSGTANTVGISSTAPRKTVQEQNGGRPQVPKKASQSGGAVARKRGEEILDNGNVLINSGVDRIFVVVVAILVCFGSIMVFSASYAYTSSRYGDSFFYIRKQVIWATAGIIAMVIVSKMPVTFFKAWAVPLYGVTLLLLAAVLVIGSSGGGAKRWIFIGGMSFQPSELAKFTLALMLAWYLAKFDYKSEDKNPKTAFMYGTFFPLCMIGAIVLLVALEKHLSGIIIITLVGAIVIFASGVGLKWYALFGGMGALGIAAFALLTDYTKRRIDIWQNPEAFPLDGGWQTIQGMLAIGSGGFFGLGLGNSRQKFSYVSQPQNDFIFTIVCEELGFIGAVAVIVLFGIFVWRGFVIATHAPDKFSSLVVFGIVSKVAIQVLLNIAVVTNTIPNTGISLPFFSYGGSSLVMLLAEMGVVLSISRFSTQKR